MRELSVKRKGVLTDEEIKLWFLRKGFSVSVPIGDDDKYDFIVDIDGKLLRMQSKTGNTTRTNGCLNFSCASIKYNSTGTHRTQYTKNDIDYFCTLHPDSHQIYIVPVELCGNECNLRFTPASSNNQNGVKMAAEFEGDKMIERILNT